MRPTRRSSARTLASHTSACACAPRSGRRHLGCSFASCRPRAVRALLPAPLPPQLSPTSRIEGSGQQKRFFRFWIVHFEEVFLSNLSETARSLGSMQGNHGIEPGEEIRTLSRLSFTPKAGSDIRVVSEGFDKALQMSSGTGVAPRQLARVENSAIKLF